jgi:hypothetical protein
MIWLAPAAFLGLTALAGPILVHLLRRRHARRLIVPSVRFVVAAEESAVRFRGITDPGLLFVRIAIIAAAVLALARPVFLTDARSASWANRISRAVLVDTSESARLITDEAVVAQSSGADPLSRIEGRDLASGLNRAVAWLAQTPPSRREIVVLSDFQRGVLSESDIAAVPLEIGIRLVRVASASAVNHSGVRVLSGGTAFAGDVELDAQSTAVSYKADTASWAGLEVRTAPEDSRAVGPLLRVLSRAGVRAPDPDRPITVRFGAAAGRSAGEPAADDWTFGAGQRLLTAIRGLDVPVNVSSDKGTLLVDATADPGSLAAAQVTAAALNERIDPEALTEREPAVIPQTVLSGWSREPAPPDPGDWRQTDSSDGRFLWGLALLLLGVESVLRRRTPPSVERAERHAA